MAAQNAKFGNDEATARRKSQRQRRNGLPLPRPCTPDEIIDKARQYGPASVEALADEMANGNGMARIVAANSLLDRGFGKVGQPIELTGRGGAPVALEHGVSPEVQAALAALHEVRR